MSDQLEILKNRLFVNLSKYPFTEKVFKKQLLNRVQEDAWLENDLVLVLLKQHRNIDIIENFFKNIHDYNELLLSDFAVKLSGKEKGYDKSILDTWSEVNAFDFLIKKGYKELSLIPTETYKTPDFSDSNNNIFEVKNVRNPEEYDSLIIKMTYTN